MLIVTKIVINCFVAFYNKQEQSYIFEIRNHLLSLDVENKVIRCINKSGEITLVVANLRHVKKKSVSVKVSAQQRADKELTN